MALYYEYIILIFEKYASVKIESIFIYYDIRKIIIKNKM